MVVIGSMETRLNPIRTGGGGGGGGVFHQARGVLPITLEVKGTQSKLSDFPNI